MESNITSQIRRKNTKRVWDLRKEFVEAIIQLMKDHNLTVLTDISLMLKTRFGANIIFKDIWLYDDSSAMVSSLHTYETYYLTELQTEDLGELLDAMIMRLKNN